MKSNTCLLVVLVQVGIQIVGAGAALAQTPTEGSSRPYTGLFGASAPRPTSRHAMDFMVSLTEGYNDDTSPQTGQVVDPLAGASSGLQTMLVANGSYSWRGASVQFGVNGTSALAYYKDLSETRSLSHNIGLGFSARLSERTSVFVNQSAAYSPSYLYGLFPAAAPVIPGEGLPAAPEYSIEARDTYSYNTWMSLTHSVTRRNRLSLAGDFTYTDYPQESATLGDLRVAGLRAQFSRNLKRNTVLTPAYRFRNGNMGFGLEPTVEHGFDIAVDHNRPLSATRRAFFGVRLGASTVKIPPAAVATTAIGPVRRYFADGQLSVGYQFSRGWQTRGMYRRGMEYVPSLTEPVFTNGLSVNVDGLMTRRVDVALSGGYSTGVSALHLHTSAFETYTGDVRIRYAVNRTLAASVEYMYYFYDFSENKQLAPGLPTRFERNAIRVGLTLWVPVVQR